MTAPCKNSRGDFGVVNCPALVSRKPYAQATNYDKDVRIVAMDDLCLELEKDSQLSVADEKQYVPGALRVLSACCCDAPCAKLNALRICRITNLILDRLENDPSHDVQSGAVKW